MFSYRLGTINYFQLGIKSVSRYSKPYTYSTFIREEKVIGIHLLSLQVNLKATRYDSK